MNPKLKEKLMESLTAVLPITLIVLALSVVLVPMDVGTAVMFTVGAVLLVFGMGLFQLGAEMAMSPLGEGIGVQMERVKKIPVIVAIAFVMGVIITIAEPDLQVLAQQVPSIPNKVLIYSIAVGVGAFLALAVVRILKRISLSKLLLALYGLLAVVSVFVPESFLAVAYDSGGVTTGPITVPFIMAMGVGMRRCVATKTRRATVSVWSRFPASAPFWRCCCSAVSLTRRTRPIRRRLCLKLRRRRMSR